MIISKVWAMYFSATGTTQKVVTGIADAIGHKLLAPREDFDFTLPRGRERRPVFHDGELVVFGTPVIAGRIPNVLLKFLDSMQGGGAIAIPVSVFGNRAYDDALIEARDILENRGFHTVAAAAFIGEHAFSRTLGGGRPDEKDMALVEAFAAQAAEKVAALVSTAQLEPLQVKGMPHPYRGYYQPRDAEGQAVDLRKVTPVTNKKRCRDCGLCARICPVGSIDQEDPGKLNGICIKCCACIKKCPVRARSFDDPAFIYHREELEEEFVQRAEPEFFL
ncbi:EFR1 family ferrodoxin [Oxalobacter sp. OttesenSCG-928-P03]|nr:EFR1 family ferrodoxin [Oxalobacter sp. OttesenSCG-928-P03]